MGESLAESLNRDCRCISIDHPRLEAETKRLMEESHVAFEPWDKSALFASVPVYIGRRHLEEMQATVVAIEVLTRSPVYRETVLSRAKDLAKLENPSRGVFFGYDFHLGQHGPQLIEVNTNAGGAMLNLLLGKAQKVCVAGMDVPVECATNLEGLEERFVDMFRSDWVLSRGDRPLETIAIVDDDPEQQFLYREFLLFRQLLRRAGFEAIIADPRALRHESGQLTLEGKRIDLVYNRLVDFYLDEPRHRALRDAYVEGSVVLTPHPQAHALYADKRNLVLLRDEALLNEAGLSLDQRATLLRTVPETRLLDKAEAEAFWRDRKSWFFKPIQGYGSKAAYRGDKLTKSTFAEILERDYVAQRLVPPSQRHVEVDGVVVPLKLDVRCFVYDRKVELWAARLYNGQTTNFRTLGGGFAPIYTETSSARADR
jgi:hypothetical protein